MKDAIALIGAALAKREQPAQPAVGRAIHRISEQARSISEVEAYADDELDPVHLARREMTAHHTRKRVAVRNGDCLEAEQLRRRYQLFGMRATTQEGEIGGDVELGVAGRREGH